jgi:hypothetical protein
VLEPTAGNSRHALTSTTTGKAQGRLMKRTDDSPADLETLTDKELIASTRHWQALRSERTPDAERMAGLYEDEMNRRFGGVTTVTSPLCSDVPSEAKPWWRFWQAPRQVDSIETDEKREL